MKRAPLDAPKKKYRGKICSRYFSLPNSYSVFFGKVHSVAFANAIGLKKLRELLACCVDPEIAKRILVKDIPTLNYKS